MSNETKDNIPYLPHGDMSTSGQTILTYVDDNTETCVSATTAFDEAMTLYAKDISNEQVVGFYNDFPSVFDKSTPNIVGIEPNQISKPNSELEIVKRMLERVKNKSDINFTVYSNSLGHDVISITEKIVGKTELLCDFYFDANGHLLYVST